MSETVLIARIGAAHGIKGDVRVKPFGDDPLALGDFDSLTDESGTAFRIASLRPAKGGMLVVRFKGVNDRSTAEALNGRDLFVKRSALPEPEDDEFYHTDLIGCRADDQAGVLLGQVTAISNFGAGDLLDIRLEDGGSVLVPFTSEFVPEIDIASRRVVIAVIDGLLPDET